MTPDELKRCFPNASRSTILANLGEGGGEAKAAVPCAGRGTTTNACQPSSGPSPGPACSPTLPPDAAERETGRGGLQEQIRNYCRLQEPEWLVIQARADKKSTIALGCHDLTVVLPGGRWLAGECKSATGEFSPDQIRWGEKMWLLGHEVREWRALSQFIADAKAEMKKP